MEIVLLQRIEKLGQMGDVVSVKEGYARNFLLPQGKALRATKPNLARFETERAQLEAHNLEQRGEAEAAAAKLDGQQFVIIRQASEAGSLYGSVTSRDVAEVATEGGFTIERRQVVMGMHVDEPWRDDQTGGIDPPVRAPTREGADRRDTRALDGQIAAKSWPPRAIDDQAPFDDQMAPARRLARLAHALTRVHRLFPCLDRPVSYGQGCHAN